MATVSDSVDSLFDPQPDPKRPVPSELADFLAALFDGLPGFIELRVIDPESGKAFSQFAANPDVAAQMILHLREKHPTRNIYHALATRLSTADGSKKNLRALRVLWADCDSMGPEQAVEVAEMMGLPAPSIVVASGKGAHLYWLLAEPLDVRDSTVEGKFNIGAVESRLRGICEAALGDWNVTDASRVLRPPATTNNPTPKKREAGRVPAPVKLVSFNPERRYTLANFDAFQAPPRSGAKAVAIENATWAEWAGGSEEELPERLRELLAKHEILALHFRREVDSTGDHSADDYRLGCLAARYRCSEEEIYQLLAASRRAYVGDDKSERDDYFRRTALGCFEEANPLLVAQRQFTEVPVQPEPEESGYQPLFDYYKDSNIPKSTRHNANEAVKALGIRPRRDTFRNRVVLSGNLSALERGGFGNVSRVLDDSGARAVGGVARETWRLDLEPGKIHEALDEQADRDCFDSLREHLESLQWDGTPRLGDWLVKYAGAEDTPLNRAIGRIFLLGAVARGFVPGIKFDTMPIFEGPQGAEKSSMLEVLGGDFYLAGLPLRDLNDKDVIGNAQGSWIVELEELANLSKTSVNGLKAFQSRRVDRCRPPYERIARDFPRRFVFAGTTNDAAYLRDATGNRRFLPVTVGRINLAALRRDRDRLLAETVAEWQAAADAQRAKGEPEALALVLPRELWGDAAEQQEARRLRDAWEDPIAKWLDELPPERVVVTGAEVLSGALHFNLQQRSAQADVDARLRRIMGGLGWKYDRRRVPGEGDRRARGFWRPKS